MVQMEWWVYALGSAPVGALISGLVLLGDRVLARRTSDADRRAATRLDYDNLLFKKREEAFDAAQSCLFALTSKDIPIIPGQAHLVDDEWYSETQRELVEAERALQRYAPATYTPLRRARLGLMTINLNSIHMQHADDAEQVEQLEDSVNTLKLELRDLEVDFRILMIEEMKRLPLED